MNTAQDLFGHVKIDRPEPPNTDTDLFCYVDPGADEIFNHAINVNPALHWANYDTI